MNLGKNFNQLTTPIGPLDYATYTESKTNGRMGEIQINKEINIQTDIGSTVLFHNVTDKRTQTCTHI